MHMCKRRLSRCLSEYCTLLMKKKPKRPWSRCLKSIISSSQPPKALQGPFIFYVAHAWDWKVEVVVSVDQVQRVVPVCCLVQYTLHVKGGLYIATVWAQSSIHLHCTVLVIVSAAQWQMKGVSGNQQ